MVEVIVDQLAPASLGASLTNVATTITLATGDGAGKNFPTTGTYRIRIDDEIISIASRSGDVLTVAARGVAPSSAASHANGARVDLIITAVALDAYFVPATGGQFTGKVGFGGAADHWVHVVSSNDDHLRLQRSGSSLLFKAYISGGRELTFEKPAGGDVGAGLNTIIRFTSIGGIDAINPFWSGLQFFGHTVTDAGNATFPILNFYARSALAADPTDYEFLFGVGNTNNLPAGISFQSPDIAGSFLRFLIGSGTVLKVRRSASNAGVLDLQQVATPSNPAASTSSLYAKSDAYLYRLGPSGSEHRLLEASSVSVAFTDGDTARRVTVTDANVTASSLILGTVIRPTTALADDKGYRYAATVVSRGAGTFDAWIHCTDVGGEDPMLDPPNETVTYVYSVGL